MVQRGTEEIKKDLSELRQHLIQCKDELRVQMNLARHEMNDEMEKLELAWDQFARKLKGLVEGAGELTEEAAQSTEAMAKSLLAKFGHIKDKLKNKVES